ncbi:MAG: hypothetical protein F6K19_35355 [Cyanothece sp. SIO1E1]|nr:hypothetical protein [Cyanothece sp. SIO1E1]
MKTILSWSLIASSTLAIAGCSGVDLDDVSNLAEQGIRVASEYPKITRDLYGSCIRAIEYRDRAREDLIGESNLEKRCIESLEIEKVTQDNADRVNGISKAVVLSDVLEKYFAAIGQLSGANVSLMSESGNLAMAVEGLLQDPSPRTQAEVQAAGNILNFVSELITRSIRNNTLRTEITDRNDDVGIVINALDTQIGVYKDLLSEEEGEMNAFYEIALQRYRDNRKNNTDEGLVDSQQSDELYPLLEVIINTQWNQGRSIIREKQNIADNYKLALQELRNSHNSVSETLVSLSLDRELSDQDLQEVNRVLAEHSGKLTLTMQQLKESFKNLETLENK